MNNIPNEIIITIIQHLIIKNLCILRLINKLWKNICNDILKEHNRKWHYRNNMYMKIIRDQMTNFYVRYPNKDPCFSSSTISGPKFITSINNNIKLVNIPSLLDYNNTFKEIKIEDCGYRTKYINDKRFINKIAYINGSMYEYDTVNLPIENIKCDICENVAFLPIMLRYVDEYEDLDYRMLYSIICLKCMSCYICGHNCMNVMDSIIFNSKIQFICEKCDDLLSYSSHDSDDDLTRYYNQKDISIMIGYTQDEVKVSTYCYEIS